MGRSRRRGAGNTSVPKGQIRPRLLPAVPLKQDAEVTRRGHRRLCGLAGRPGPGSPQLHPLGAGNRLSLRPAAGGRQIDQRPQQEHGQRPQEQQRGRSFDCPAKLSFTWLPGLLPGFHCIALGLCRLSVAIVGPEAHLEARFRPTRAGRDYSPPAARYATGQRVS